MASDQSEAVSARYTVRCPVCWAMGGKPCRTLKTGRITDTHAKRIAAQYATGGTRQR